MNTRPSAILAAARQYHGYHWSVIPMRSHDKRPLIKWQAFQQRPATADEIEGWYEHWPTANVGIVTGKVSGLVVLDIDTSHGGEKSLARWEHEHGRLPTTVEATSGGGGRHLYFAHPGGVMLNRVGIVPGIDLRGDGGCIVAPPSVHRSGNTYAWVNGREPEQVEMAKLPGWLAELLRGDSASPGHSRSFWRQLIESGVATGSRNSTIASLAGHLFWHGVDSAVVMELLLCWNRVRCSPPLEDDEVISTVASISRLQRRVEA